MITIQSGKLFIPENERFVGFAGDDRAAVRRILLPEGYSDHGCVYTLFLRFDDDRVTSAPLTVQEQEDNSLVATWVVRCEQILKHGIIMAQLRVNYEDGTVEHTGCDYFVAAPSAEFADGQEIDMLNRTEFEERMAQAVRESRRIAPYIGEDGYWYVYSSDEEAYVRSFYAQGSAIDSALSDVSTNAVENRVVKAALDSKVDASRRVAGLPLSANISKEALTESIIGKINPSSVDPDAALGYIAQYGRTIDGDPVFCREANQWEELAKASDIPVILSQLEDGSYAVRKYAASSAPPTQASTAAYTVPCLWYYDGNVWYVYADTTSVVSSIVYHTYSSVKLTDGQDISGKMDLVPTINSSSDVANLAIGQVFKCQGSIGIRDNSAAGYTELAKYSAIPTKTSDLTNDSGFLTLNTLPIYNGGVQ